MTEGGIELAVGYVSVVVEGSKISPQIKREFAKVGLDAERAGKSSGRRFSKGVGSTLKAGAGLGAALGIGKVIKDSVHLEATFSKTMAQVAAATGGPTDALSKLAIKLGADTQYSANEASGAMLELAKSGITTSEIMGGALSGTLLLASAGSTDLGTASTIASNAMNTFGLKGKDMAKIAYALAGGANASSASVESLGQGLSQVGPGAKNAGLSLQQTVGVLSAFDAAGIKGSDAGTSLKTMLTSLVPQTKKAKDAMKALGLDFTNADGSFVSITNVAEQLKNKLGPLSAAQRTTALATIFGSDASRAATVLMNQGSKGLATYIKATKDQGAAQKLAKANMSGTAGALERLGGAVETAELQLGQALAPAIQKTADFLADDAIPAITGFVSGMQDGTGAGGELADKLGDAVDFGKGLVQFFDDVPGPIKKTALEVAALSLVWKKFLMPGRAQAISWSRSAQASFSSTRGSLSMLRADIGVLASTWATAGTRTERELNRSRAASARLSTQFGGLRSAASSAAGIGGMLLLTSSTQQASKGLGALEGAAGGALSGFQVGGPIGAGIGAVGGGLLGLFTSGHKAADGIAAAAEAAATRKADIDELKTSLNQTTGAFTKLAAETVAADLRANGAFDYGETLGLSMNTVTNAALGIPSAVAKVQAAVDKANATFNKTSVSVDAFGNVVVNNGVAYDRATSAAGGLVRTLGDVKDTSKSAKLEVLRNQLAVGNLGRALANVPDSKILKIGTEGAPRARADIVDLAARGKGLSDKQVKILLKTAGLPNTLEDIARVQEEANKLDGRTVGIRVKVTASSNANVAERAAEDAGRSIAGKRANGGPVRKDLPYLVGERGPEIFIPSQRGQIEANRPAATSGKAAVAGGLGLPTRAVVRLADGIELEAFIEAVVDDRIASTP